MTEQENKDTLLATLQLFLAVFVLVITNIEVPDRVMLLMQQGRYSVLATTGVIWVLGLLAIFAILTQTSGLVRFLWGTLIALGGSVAWGFQKAARLEISVFDLLGFWEARHETGDAAGLYGHAMVQAALLFGCSMLIFSAPFLSRLWYGRKFVALKSVLPLLPLAAIAGIVFIKGGNGHFALPKQFSQFSLAGLAAGKIIANPIMPHREASLRLSSNKKPSRIILMVEESLRPDYVSDKPGNNMTPHFAAFANKFVSYGQASSGAICSSYANALLRFMAARDDVGAKINGNTTVWQYAKAAGYRTVYIDAQAHAIQNETRLQNFMRLEERKMIDNFYPLVDTTSKDADMTLLAAIEAELAKPGPVFIYANKRGMHFPYDENYDHAKALFHPMESEVEGREINSMINSYRNAVAANVDGFFNAFAKRVSLKDTAMIYTSDHGQYFSTNDSTHCKAFDSHPQMALVPLFAFVDSAAGMNALAAGAEKLNGKASHFQIAGTLLEWMGFDHKAVLEHHKESLTSGSDLEPSYTVGDIFGLFSSQVEWVNIDLKKDYLEPQVKQLAAKSGE
jgi:glucan phosphoethanolaminetransferase (alkaline phosphatase superfamily)